MVGMTTLEPSFSLPTVLFQNFMAYTNQPKARVALYVYQAIFTTNICVSNMARGLYGNTRKCAKWSKVNSLRVIWRWAHSDSSLSIKYNQIISDRCYKKDDIR
jgi:hypothetical protein